MLFVMDKSTHEEHLSQPLQTNNKKFEKAVTFLTVYNGIFNVTNSNNKFHFKKSITDEDVFIQLTISPGAYEIESLNNEVKRIIIGVGHFTEAEYAFTIKPNFTTLGSIREIMPQGPIIRLVFDDTIGNFLGLWEAILYREYNLPHNSVDILGFDKTFLKCFFAKEMIFKSKRSGTIHNFTMDVDPGYKYFEKFRGGV